MGVRGPQEVGRVIGRHPLHGGRFVVLPQRMGHTGRIVREGHDGTRQLVQIVLLLPDELRVDIVRHLQDVQSPAISRPNPLHRSSDISQESCCPLESLSHFIRGLKAFQQPSLGYRLGHLGDFCIEFAGHSDECRGLLRDNRHVLRLAVELPKEESRFRAVLFGQLPGTLLGLLPGYDILRSPRLHLPTGLPSDSPGGSHEAISILGSRPVVPPDITPGYLTHGFPRNSCIVEDLRSPPRSGNLISDALGQRLPVGVHQWLGILDHLSGFVRGHLDTRGFNIR